MVIKSYLYRLIVTLTRVYGYEVSNSKAEGVNRRRIEELRDVMLYVEEHYGEQFTLNSISKLARMEPLSFL
ncbi:hypothetical protein J7E85_09985 [Paenibacillus sp. ISL-20]|nr:hypothetical protein [Paenibacillus sp. ISL-20]